MQVRFIIFLLVVCTVYGTGYSSKPSLLHLPGSLNDANASLHAPVRFTNNGIQTFLKQTFNHPEYARQVLAHDFSHFVQFLQHGKRMGQKRSYAKQVIRLFTNRLKSTPFINPYAFSNLLSELSDLLSEYFIIFKLADLDPAKLIINDISMNHFAAQFLLFKDNPKQFFDDLSSQIIDALNNRYQIVEEVTAEDLRKSVLIFLEVALNKLVWSPDEQVETWNLCKKIADQLALLMESNIICDPDDLNDLFITLIERYCYFLDVTNNDLPTPFFEKLKQSVATESLVFLEMEEQEQGIETKSERLMRAVLEGEARARARESGIIPKKK